MWNYQPQPQQGPSSGDAGGGGQQQQPQQQQQQFSAAPVYPTAQYASTPNYQQQQQQQQPPPNGYQQQHHMPQQQQPPQQQQQMAHPYYHWQNHPHHHPQAAPGYNSWLPIDRPDAQQPPHQQYQQHQQMQHYQQQQPAHHQQYQQQQQHMQPAQRQWPPLPHHPQQHQPRQDYYYQQHGNMRNNGYGTSWQQQQHIRQRTSEEGYDVEDEMEEIEMPYEDDLVIEDDDDDDDDDLDDDDDDDDDEEEEDEDSEDDSDDGEEEEEDAVEEDEQEIVVDEDDDDELGSDDEEQVGAPLQFRDHLPKGVGRAHLATLGPEERKAACLESLAEYLEACGGKRSAVATWTAAVEQRREGSSAGSLDVYYFDPEFGRRFRSRAEVARLFGLNGAPQRAPRNNSSQKSLQFKAATKSKEAKKARKRQMHVKRFGAISRPMRRSLWRILEFAHTFGQERYDRSTELLIMQPQRSTAALKAEASELKLERLKLKFNEAGEREAVARSRLKLSQERDRTTNDAASSLKEVERDMRTVERLYKTTTRLAMLVSEAEMSTQRREATEENRRLKREQREAEISAKRAERTADFEQRKEQRALAVERRRRERDGEVLQRRAEKEAESEKAAAHKAMLEIQRREAARYPIEDSFVYLEPERIPPLPPMPAPTASAEILIGTPADSVGDVISMHALLRLVVIPPNAPTTTTAENKRDKKKKKKQQAPQSHSVYRKRLWSELPTLGALAASLACDGAAYRGPQGAQRALRCLHVALLEALLEDATADAWWPCAVDAAGITELALAGSGELSRRGEHPWGRLARNCELRCASDEQQADVVSEVDLEYCRQTSLNEQADSVIASVEAGEEKDSVLRKWVISLDQCGLVVDGCFSGARDSLVCAARFTTCHKPIGLFFHSLLAKLPDVASDAAPRDKEALDSVKKMATSVAARVREVRSSAFVGPAANHDASQRRVAARAAAKWTDYLTNRRPNTDTVLILCNSTEERPLGGDYDEDDERDEEEQVCELIEDDDDDDDEDEEEDAIITTKVDTDGQPLVLPAKVQQQPGAAKSRSRKPPVANASQPAKRQRPSRAIVKNNPGAAPPPKKVVAKPATTAGKSRSRSNGSSSRKPAVVERDENGWRITGSPHVHRKVRRSILDEEGAPVSMCEGFVSGWLPAEESDYITDSGEPRALYRVKLETGDLAGEVEDLDLEEVVDSLVPDASLEAAAALEAKAKEEAETIRRLERRKVRKFKKEERFLTFMIGPTPGGGGVTQAASQARKRKRSSTAAPVAATPLLTTETPVVVPDVDAEILAKEQAATLAAKIAEQEAERAAIRKPVGAFPRRALVRALRAEAVWLRAERQRRRKMENSSAEDPAAAPSSIVEPRPLLPRPPMEALGPSTWSTLVGAVCARLLSRDVAVGKPPRSPTLERASNWLLEGAPYSGLNARERIAVLKALCDAFAGSQACVSLIERSAEAAMARTARYEAEDRERKRKAAEKERETTAAVRERLGVNAAGASPTPPQAPQAAVVAAAQSAKEMASAAALASARAAAQRPQPTLASQQIILQQQLARARQMREREQQQEAFIVQQQQQQQQQLLQQRQKEAHDQQKQEQLVKEQKEAEDREQQKLQLEEEKKREEELSSDNFTYDDPSLKNKTEPLQHTEPPPAAGLRGSASLPAATKQHLNALSNPGLLATGGTPAPKPRAKKPRVGAAPPPLSAALDRLLVLDAPVTIEQNNPKLAGSHCYALYERYREATTLSEVLRLGGRRSDVYNDLARAYTKLTNTDHLRIYHDAVKESAPKSSSDQQVPMDTEEEPHDDDVAAVPQTQQLEEQPEMEVEEQEEVPAVDEAQLKLELEQKQQQEELEQKQLLLLQKQEKQEQKQEQKEERQQEQRHKQQKREQQEAKEERNKQQEQPQSKSLSALAALANVASSQDQAGLKALLKEEEEDEKKRASPTPQPEQQQRSSGQPTRHRFRAEVAHVRLVEACGGGEIEFLPGLGAVERKELRVQQWEDGAVERMRPARERAIAALRRATELQDVGSLRAAIANAKRGDVRLEADQPEEEDEKPKIVDQSNGRQLQEAKEEAKAKKRKDAELVLLKEAEDDDKTVDDEVMRRRWMIKELADAYEALRDAEVKAERENRRRERFADKRAMTLPRVEALGYDRDRCQYWAFPSDAYNDDEPRIWKTQTNGERGPNDRPPTWSAYVGEPAIRSFAAALDDRGLRERELRNVILDLLPTTSTLAAPPPPTGDHPDDQLAVQNNNGNGNNNGGSNNGSSNNGNSA